jgi:hypothetical protein
LYNNSRLWFNAHSASACMPIHPSPNCDRITSTLARRSHHSFVSYKPSQLRNIYNISCIMYHASCISSSKFICHPSTVCITFHGNVDRRSPQTGHSKCKHSFTNILSKNETNSVDHILFSPNNKLNHPNNSFLPPSKSSHRCLLANGGVTSF